MLTYNFQNSNLVELCATVDGLRAKTDAANCLRAVSRAHNGQTYGARFHSSSKPHLLNVNLARKFIKFATYDKEYGQRIDNCYIQQFCRHAF